MVTSTPIKALQKTGLRIEEIVPDIQNESTVLEDETWSKLYDSRTRSRQSSLNRSNVTLEEIPPETRKRHLTITTLPGESITSDESDLIERKAPRRKTRDFGVNTETRPRALQYSRFLIEDIAPEIKKEIEKRSRGTSTSMTMRNVLTREDAALLVNDALKIYKTALTKETSSRGVQCTPEPAKAVEKRDQAVQMNEQFRMRSHVSVTAKPRTTEVGVEVRLGPCTRTVCIGPDPAATVQPVSLNSMMNSRSHSFNYGDTRSKPRRAGGGGKSVGVMVDDLIRTSTRATDTSGLAPNRREFGTSPMKKKFVDVSVGDSVRPHISISCAANYCDNCKETIKSLAKQIANNAENSLNHLNSSQVSRIPRPSHIPLNSGDHHTRRQFKRQDTYTKIPATGVIRYDTDNKEQYDNSNRSVREIYPNFFFLFNFIAFYFVSLFFLAINFPFRSFAFLPCLIFFYR